MSSSGGDKTIERDKGHYDGAADHLVNVKAHFCRVQRVIEQRDEEGTQHRTPDSTGPSVDADASDYACAHNVEHH